MPDALNINGTTGLGHCDRFWKSSDDWRIAPVSEGLKLVSNIESWGHPEGGRSGEKAEREADRLNAESRDVAKIAVSTSVWISKNGTPDSPDSDNPERDSRLISGDDITDDGEKLRGGQCLSHLYDTLFV